MKTISGELPMTCTICGIGRLDKTFIETRDIITGELFSLIECDHCKVKKTHPIPDDMSRYYETDLGEAMRKDPGKLYAALKRRLLNIELSRITKVVKDAEFLDIGCGTGDFSRLIHEKGLKVSAVDSAFKRPAYISENNSIPYYCIDYNDYGIKGFAGMRNGVAILRHVLEHIKEPGSFIERMLGYGANTFYVAVPNISSLKSKLLGQYCWHLDPPRHVWHFDHNSLDLFFRRLGFKVAARGFDTIPIIVPSLYRYMRMKGVSQRVCNIFEPKGIVSTLSLPFDWILPNDIIWVIAQKG